MTGHVIALPSRLHPADITGKAVVVFDVLRATTSITAALNAGVAEIRVFDNTQAAAAAAAGFPGPKLLCGEINTLPPPGFDLGNSPGDFQRSLHAGKTMFMSTTNGTRAIVAARAADQLLTGALVNAASVARALVAGRRDFTLLCSGTQGTVSLEDLIGAGAVLDALLTSDGVHLTGDVAHIALRLFQSARADLGAALREGNGGHNIIRVGLDADIDFCARLNFLSIVGQVSDNPLTVRPLCQ
jgi:2-phosphosulfolactate phosphatase